jgi:acyl-CoA hydrolase
VSDKTELAPGEAAEVTITLRPEQTGTQTATFIFQTDDTRQPGRAVFLTNTRTIGFSTFGSVTFSFENIQQDELPVLPPVGAALTNNNARITQVTPAVQTTNPINITYEGQARPFNNPVNRSVEPIRFIDIQTENLSNSTFVNNTIEFSVAKTNISNAGAGDVELYQYNGTAGQYEPLSTSDPVPGDNDFRYTATYTDVDRDLMIAAGAPEILVQPDTVTAPGTATVGDTVEITATVENTGEVSGDITVNLTRNRTTVNNTSVTVDAGDTQNISLSTQLTQTGDQTVTVEGPQNRVNRTVTVLVQGADVSLQSDSIKAPDTVTAGDTIEITAAVANIGNESGDITVNLTQNGRRINNTSVTVSADGTSNISLSTQLNQTGNQTLTVEGPQNRVNKTVTVQPQPANISLRPRNVTDPKTIIEDNRAELDVTVRNTGGESGNITVNLTRNGIRVNNTSVTVSGNDTEIISLSTQLNQTGNQTLIVAGPQNSDSRTVRVLAQANISLQSDSVSAPDTATAGDTVDITATVQNTGGVSGDITLNLTRDEIRVNNTTVTVNESTEQNISLSTQLNQTGNQTLTVEGPQNRVNKTVNVTPQDTVSDPGGETGTENDGFGVGTALIAFLTIALWIRRIDENS